MSHPDLFGWGSAVERERRIRIRLCIAAYAYEIADAPLMSDAAFDALARSSDPTVTTGKYDAWWRANYTAHSGMWIRSHPALREVEKTWRRLNSQPASS